MSQNPKNSDLQTIFDRIEAGKRLSKQDLQTLVVAVRSQRITLATGDRAVGIDGSAEGAVVVTGDRNLVITGADAAIIRELISNRPQNEKLLLKLKAPPYMALSPSSRLHCASRGNTRGQSVSGQTRCYSQQSLSADDSSTVGSRG